MSHQGAGLKIKIAIIKNKSLMQVMLTQSSAVSYLCYQKNQQQ